ncbi:SDR family NAD(P)-dependent oxidoreductase [Ilumatobacter nonamiensis]|uniref:SDR family NAD(P)-dependent oxidoreductase n=1 Tax=Ilumatobacter nonamiensis TaxID=467093 RepID=UPI00058B370D|nr:SDR family oxidoreductase [Ilumatobacter nonamiensis]
MATWTRALVTGASSGIGREIALQLAAAGTELVVVARDGDRLDALAAEVDVDCQVLIADLADPNELSYVEDRVRQGNDPIDLLVNNAGFGFQGPFHELDLEREAAVVDVNVVALHRLAHVAATRMAQVGHGGILNVSSMSGYLATPNSATYSATKAFVTALSEAMHGELEPLGVHVTALCPGFTRTEFQDRGSYDASGIPDFAWQDAPEVATAGLDGIATNRTIVVPGVANRIGATAIDVMPGALRRFAVGKMAR